MGRRACFYFPSFDKHIYRDFISKTGEFEAFMNLEDITTMDTIVFSHLRFPARLWSTFLSGLNFRLFPLLFHVTKSLFGYRRIRGSWIRLRVRVIHASDNISGQAAVHEYYDISVVVDDTGFHKGTACCMMGGWKCA